MTEPAIATSMSAGALSASPGSASMDQERCPSCGGGITVRFCGECGERRQSERVYSMREFAHEAFEVATNVERSFLRTLWTLVRRPGELTAAYMRGERVRYLRPLQLFLLVNVAFFLLAGSGVTVFSAPLNNHLNSTPYRQQAREVVLRRRPMTGMSEEQYRAAFDQRSLVLARTLVISMVPAFALAVALLSLRRRRPAVQHLVFSLHFLSYMVLLTIAVIYVLLAGAPVWRAVGWPVSDAGADQMAALFIGVGVVAFLFSALRRAYGNGTISASVKAVVSCAVLTFILVGYRLLLFYVTAYTL